MWPPWGNRRLPHGGAAASPATPPPSSSSVRSTSSSRASSPPPPVPHHVRSSSSSSSLKDLLSLLEDYEADDLSTTLSRAPSPPLPPPVVHHVRSASSALRPWCSPPEDPFGLPPGEEKRVVLYFTSLRVVRPTFHDCAAVRSILHGLRVAVDERDVSLDPGFLRELKGILGGRLQPPGLPQLFIGGRHVGGADEVRWLHEAGELRRYVDGALTAATGACRWCGDIRFVICRRCSGSRLRYSEKGGAGGAFRACTACNENGLVRCPRCCAPDAV